MGLAAPETLVNSDKKGLCGNTYLGCMLSISYLPLLTQADFDHLLWACDFNFVRGEDSVVRAIWAGKPFVWQIYPQDDGAHGPKLRAFLGMLGATPSLQTFHSVWNGITGHDCPAQGLPAIDLKDWVNIAQTARQRLRMQPDLVTQLLDFVNVRLSNAG